MPSGSSPRGMRSRETTAVAPEEASATNAVAGRVNDWKV